MLFMIMWEIYKDCIFRLSLMIITSDERDETMENIWTFFFL